MTIYSKASDNNKNNKSTSGVFSILGSKKTGNSKIRMVNLQLPQYFQEETYNVKLDVNVILCDMPDSFNISPKNLYKLRRFWGEVPVWWPISSDVSSSWPLYLYYLILLDAGQKIVAIELVNFLRSVNSKQLRIGISIDKIDDFFRCALKKLHDYSYNRIFDEGPAYMLFCHLHSLTGKSPYTEDQILEDITSWTSEYKNGDKKDGLKQINMKYIAKTMDRLVVDWKISEADGFLSFKQYANDFLRWGTSGGAGASMYLGSKYRTKWAWALSRATNEDGSLKEKYDLYSESLKEGKVALVALKEEAQKTREIITTPMSSYMRQSYLLYRRGKPRMNSPISNDHWLPLFESTYPRWYGCIDGSRFDHLISKEAVLYIIRRLGELDEETKKVAQDEIKFIEDLKIQWKDKQFRYKGGLLSGWRLTSIIGSIVSMAVCEYINDSLNTALSYGVMGDDIVLYSYSKDIKKEVIVELYNRFGLKSNLSKTVTGRIGEFLRKVRSIGGAWGFPALSLRSIVYANPWIESYNFDKEEELSNSWMTLLSRFTPHCTNTSNLIEQVIKKWNHNLVVSFGDKEWKKLIRTPASAGGLGCIETMSFRWYSYERKYETEQLATKYKIPAMLGVLKRKLIIKEVPMILPIDMEKTYDQSKQLNTVGETKNAIFFKQSTNITELIYRIMFFRPSIQTINSYLKNKLPLYLRVASSTKIIDFLLLGEKKMSAVTSILHTKEIQPSTQSIIKRIINIIYYNKRYNSLKSYKPILSLYYITLKGNDSVPYGTW